MKPVRVVGLELCVMCRVRISSESIYNIVRILKLHTKNPLGVKLVLTEMYVDQIKKMVARRPYEIFINWYYLITNNSNNFIDT